MQTGEHRVHLRCHGNGGRQTKRALANDSCTNVMFRRNNVVAIRHCSDSKSQMVSHVITLYHCVSVSECTPGTHY
jgi:hypothetical protein